MSQKAAPREEILEPDLRIIDPHHHLWDNPPPDPKAPPPAHGMQRAVQLYPRHMVEELTADMRSGHNIKATVFVQAGQFYRATGPEEMKPVGETEFVNGVAAMSASGRYGDIRACAGIVGHADFTIGSRVEAVLEAQKKAGNGRFRGIRQLGAYDADPNVLGALAHTPARLFYDPKFREGFAKLRPAGLTFDAWVLEPQIPDVTDLARAFPETPIVLDHVGTPLGIASYEGKLQERFPIWKKNIEELAKCPNVYVKLGGLAMAFVNFPSFLSDPPAPSTQLAEEWRPYIETCIEAFGPKRGMFESNFAVDRGACTYPTLWNAFKRITAGASADEKAELYYGSAARFYSLELDV